MKELRQLVEQAQSGDLAAFGAMVRRFQDMAYGYAYSLLRDFHLAEDAAQEAFVQAYRDLPALRKPAAFPGWFRKIVFKHCDRLTRGKRPPTVPLEAALGQLSTERDPASDAVEREMKDRVLAEIEALPEDERLVTTLFYIDGYSHKDIAEFLEAPATTINNRLHASRKRLKKRMTAMVEDTLRSHGLSDRFAEETIGRALAEARRLGEQDRCAEAEQLLRDVLRRAPDHPDVLRELNHILTNRLYGEARWDLLRQMAEHARTLIASGADDEKLNQQMAVTLLATPAMPEAVEFVAGGRRVRRRMDRTQGPQRGAAGHAGLRQGVRCRL